MIAVPQPRYFTNQRVQFFDASRCAWSVREVDGRQVPGSRGAACLIIESLVAVRRVWRYPATWRTLPDVELAALLLAR